MAVKATMYMITEDLLRYSTLPRTFSPSTRCVKLTDLRRAGVPIYYDHERARNNNYEDYLEQTHGTKSQPCVVS